MPRSDTSRSAGPRDSLLRRRPGPEPQQASRGSSWHARSTPAAIPPPGAGPRRLRRLRPGTPGVVPLAAPARPRTPLSGAADHKGGVPRAVNSTSQHGHSAAAAADFPLVGLFLISLALRLDLPSNWWMGSSPAGAPFRATSAGLGGRRKGSKVVGVKYPEMHLVERGVDDTGEPHRKDSRRLAARGV